MPRPRRIILTPREELIIKYRKEEMTYAQLGRVFSRSHECIRQVHKRGLKKLQTAQKYGVPT